MIGRSRNRALPVLAAVALLTVPAAAWCAVPVEESVPAGQRPAPAEPAAGGPASGAAAAGTEASRLAELFYELQLLRQDVQQLRGQVEEQQHRLDRLARDQQEQYLDLDRRMQTLRRGAGPAADTTASSPAGASGADPGGDSPATGRAQGTEREAYAAAFDLMKERQFGASIQAFEQLVQDYPNGVFTPNAFYWLGELHLAQEELEQARQYFAQVVNLYPDHQKMADALYKLGVAYHRLGDVERARRYLERVEREHPQSSAAGLAQTYLAEL